MAALFGTWELVAVVTLSISSASAAVPTLVFDSPRGGEVYAIGTTQKVRLGSKTRAKVVKVELSRDGGVSFELLGAIDNTVTDLAIRNVLAFTVSGASSSNCVIRASGTVGKTPVVELSSPFSIGSIGSSNNALTPGSVTNSTLAPGAISVDKITSGSVSNNFVLFSDGAGGVNFGPLPAPSTVSIGAGNSIITALNDAATTGTINGARLTDGSVTAAKLATFPKAYTQNSALISLADGVDTVLSMDTELFDTDNIHDSTTNPTRLTCNTAGVYFVSAYVAYASNNTGFRHVFVRVNGGTAISSDVRPALNSTDLTVSTIYQLNVGDYVEVFAFQNSGAALNIGLRGFMMARLP
jgi:hypothetical protein